MAVALVAAIGLNTTTNTSTNVLATPAFTPATGELIIVKGIVENSYNKLDVPVASGGGITWTQLYDSAVTDTCGATMWSGIVTSGGTSITISMKLIPGGDAWWSSVVERWTGADLSVTPVIGAQTGTNTTTTMTTLNNGSYISYLNGDWDAISPATVTYASGAVQENIHDKSTTIYVGYYAYQFAATAGNNTVGLTAPAGRKDTLIGIEVRATGSPVIVKHNLIMLGVGT